MNSVHKYIKFHYGTFYFLSYEGSSIEYYNNSQILKHTIPHIIDKVGIEHMVTSNLNIRRIINTIYIHITSISGISGSSGTSGTRGTSGTAGTSGISGSSGTSGSLL